MKLLMYEIFNHAIFYFSTGSTSKVHVTGSIATPNVRGPVAEPLR